MQRLQNHQEGPHQDLHTPDTVLILGPEAPEEPYTPALTRHRRPLPALTGLRFVAASYVVVFHTRIATLLKGSGHPVGSRFFANGFLAVALFFVLSGFILAYTYSGQVSAPGAYGRFWQARFARVWPAYLFSLLCSSFIAVPAASLALVTLCMVQAWNPWHPEFAGTWNFVCWTLSVEAFFYLIFPFAQSALERMSSRLVLAFGGSMLLVATLLNVSARTLSDPVYPPPWNLIPLPVIHLPEFLIGVALGHLFVLREHTLKALLPRWGMAWPVLTTLGVLCSLLCLATVHGRATSLILLPFTLLIAGLALESSAFGRLLSSRPLLMGGAASYSMYLLQTPVRLGIHALPFVPAGRIGLIFVPLVLIPFAYLVYLYVEEPSRKLLRRVFARLDAGSAT